MIRSVIVAGLAWLCLASAILAQQSEPPATAAPAKTPASNLMVTDRDNGREIDLAKDAMLLVQLPSNPSTGYSWSVKGDPSPLKVVKSDYKQPNQSSQKPGAPGTQVLQIKASGPGTATLNLEYRRPWEKDVPPAKVFSIKATIR